MDGTIEDRLAVLERRLAELEDIEAVRKLLARYSKAVDARDAQALAPLFAREVRVVVTPWGVDVRGHAAVMEFFVAYFQSEWKAPRHHYANELIERAGAGYTAFSYFHETLSRGTQSVVGWGTWMDRLVFEDGRWTFAERLIEILALTPVERGWAGPDRIMALERESAGSTS